VSNQNKNTVTKLQASDGTNLGTFSVGSMPSGLIYDGNNAGRNSVTRIPAIRNESSAIRNDLVLGSSWQLVLGSRLVRIHCSASSQLTGKREVIPKVRFADQPFPTQRVSPMRTVGTARVSSFQAARPFAAQRHGKAKRG